MCALRVLLAPSPDLMQACRCQQVAREVGFEEASGSSDQSQAGISESPWNVPREGAGPRDHFVRNTAGTARREENYRTAVLQAVKNSDEEQFLQKLRAAWQNKLSQPANDKVSPVIVVPDPKSTQSSLAKTNAKKLNTREPYEASPYSKKLHTSSKVEHTSVDIIRQSESRADNPTNQVTASILELSSIIKRIAH